MNASEFTKTPWKVSQSIDGDFLAIYPDTGKMELPVAKKPDFVRADVWAENATFIAHSANCHAGMLAALKAVLGDIQTFHDATGQGERVLSEEVHSQLNEAISKAEASL